jgi:proline iminopeptidase
VGLLAHSAGAILATLYAAAHPDRISRLVLVTPGLAAVGVVVTEEELRAVVESRSAEPWYPAASAALTEMLAGSMSLAAFRASRPLFYGRCPP